MADGFSLTSSLFAHYLLRGKQVPLVRSTEAGDVSTALTLTLLELGNEENHPAPNTRELRFRYKYNFWSDVTKISDGIIKNSQRWENRLKEVGPKVCDVSGFCDIWSHILQSGTFTMDANVRFFREDCKPIYELPPHVDGGKFQIFFDMDFENIDYVIPLDVIKCFLCLIIHMLCGQLGYEDNIGIALSLWHRNSDCAEEKEFIGRQLKDLFPNASHGYIVHKDQAQKFSMKLRDNERKRKQLARKRKSEKQSLEAQALANGMPRTSHQHNGSTSNSSKSVSPSDQQQRHSYPRNSPESATHSSTQEDSSNESESESGYSGEGSWSSGGGSGSDTGAYKEKALYNASKLFSHNNSNSNSWKNHNSSSRHQHNNNTVKGVEFGEFNLQESLQDSEKKPVSGIRIHSSSYPKANSHHELRDRRTSLPNIFRNGSANGTPTNSANNSNNNSPRNSDANPINTNQSKYNSPRNSDTNQSTSNNTNQNSNKHNSSETSPSATNKPWRDSASKQMSPQNQQQLHQMQQQQLQYHHQQQQLQQLQQKMLPQQSASKIQSSSTQQPEVVSPRGSNSGSSANNSNNSNYQRTLPLNDLKLMNRRRIQSMPTSAEKQEQLKEKYQHLDRPGASNTQSPRATSPEPFSPQPQLPTTQKAQHETQTEEPPLELTPSEQQQPIEPPNNSSSKSNELPHVRHSFPKSIREQQLEQASPLQPLRASPTAESLPALHTNKSPGNNNLSPREKKKQQQSNNKSKPVSPHAPNKQVSLSVMRLADVQDATDIPRDDEKSSRNVVSNATSHSGGDSKPAEFASSPVNNNSSQACEVVAKLNLVGSVEMVSGKDVNMVPSLDGALASGCGEISVDSPYNAEESPSSTANSRPQANNSSSDDSPGAQSPSVDAITTDRELVKEMVSPSSGESKSHSKPAPLPLNATNKRKKFQNFQQPKREKREESAVCPRLITPTNIFISVTVLVVSVSMGYLFI